MGKGIIRDDFTDIDETKPCKPLNDYWVVFLLAGQFVITVCVAAGKHGTQKVISLCNRYAKIFLGQDKRFLPVQNWNDYEHLGRVLAEQAEVAYRQAERDVFRCGFAKFAINILDLIQSSTGKTDAMLMCELQLLKQNMTDLLLGNVEPVKDISELSGADITAMAKRISERFG
jgi:hypothetical protein